MTWVQWCLLLEGNFYLSTVIFLFATCSDWLEKLREAMNKVACSYGYMVPLALYSWSFYDTVHCTVSLSTSPFTHTHTHTHTCMYTLTYMHDTHIYMHTHMHTHPHHTLIILQQSLRVQMWRLSLPIPCPLNQQRTFSSRDVVQVILRRHKRSQETLAWRRTWALQTMRMMYAGYYNLLC